MEIRYAISDIHNNGRAFLKLLDHVDPDPEELVIVGDLFDRGLEFWDVAEEVSQLVDEGVKLVEGNHDYWFREWLKGSMSDTTFSDSSIGGITTIKGMELASNKYGKDDVSIKLGKILYSMKPYIETDDFIFVHAGIDPRIPYMDQQKIDTLRMGSGEWKNPTFNHSFEQTIVFGHTPTYHILKDIQPEDAKVWYSPRRRKMAIDTGGGFGYRLTMVDLLEGIAYAYDFAKRDIIEYEIPYYRPKRRRRY